MSIKLNFVFDIDGTISNNGRNLATENERAILQILTNGHNVVFASARPVRDMLPLLHKKFHDCLLIGCNGGIHYKNGDFGKTHHFDDQQLIKVLDFLNSKNIPYVLDGDWHYAFSKTHHFFQDYIRSLSKFELPENEILSKGITKLLILETSIKNDFIKFLDSQDIVYNLNNHTKDNFFDITPSKNNKYIALKECNIDLNNSICFGNDENDFQMLKNAKKSVFVSGENTFDKATINVSFDEVHNVIYKILNN